MQSQANGPDPDLEKKRALVQANKDELNWRTKYRVCKFVLYIFYGHSISSSITEYFIGSLNRITISPKHLIDYVNIIYSLFTFVACISLTHCLHVNSKKQWRTLCTFHFIGIFSYKIAFCINYFVDYSLEDAMPYLDLSYCDRNYMMRDLQITRMVFVSALEIVALICFAIINAKLSKHWTQQECLKNVGTVSPSEKNQEAINIPEDIYPNFSPQDQYYPDNIINESDDDLSSIERDHPNYNPNEDDSDNHRLQEDLTQTSKE